MVITSKVNTRSKHDQVSCNLIHHLRMPGKASLNVFLFVLTNQQFFSLVSFECAVGDKYIYKTVVYQKYYSNVSGMLFQALFSYKML